MTNGGLSFGGDNELDQTLELELSLSQPGSHLEFQKSFIVDGWET